MMYLLRLFWRQFRKSRNVKMKKTKIFAAYLPQYHETEDNNKFWGDGYTDWVGVRNAKPQYEGHKQPKKPLHDNYYNLLDVDVIRKQAKLAKENGIYGFNIYHYWFKDGKQELEKPAELLLENKDIDISFFFTWDNASWKRTWDNIPGNDWAPAFDINDGENRSRGVLVEFSYGDKNKWKEHFDYLLNFFRDNRYYKVDNKPVFMFIGRNDEAILKEMGEYWNELAIQNGFSGMLLATKKKNFFSKPVFDYDFDYEPEKNAWGQRRAIEKRVTKFRGIKCHRDEPVKYRYSYEKVWKRIIKNARKNVGREILGSFVRYDDTPRRGKDAMIIEGETPEKFCEYFRNLYAICCKNNAEFMLLTAWNEWGEGAYLEPDEENEYAYLEALKRAVDNVDKEMKI